MVNTDDFIKRLEIILDYYSINASAFADKIGVQRSSLSHLLSGRNKPSLDFILKILDIYPEIDLYWILNGKGNFPKNEAVSNATSATSPLTSLTPPKNTTIAANEDLFSNSPTVEKNIPSATESRNEIPIDILDDTIEKIIFFYKDGTFKSFNKK